MNTTTGALVPSKPIVGIDLAKDCFQVAVADKHYRIQRRERLTRKRFVQFVSNHPASLMLLEACGSSHYWSRYLTALGHEVRLLPAQYIRAYVRRDKTDAADAAALIEASRCADIIPVPVKTIDQQGVQQLHRIRTHLMRTRNQRMNLLRGMLREYGIDIPLSIKRGLERVQEALETADNGVCDHVRPYIQVMMGEVRELQRRMDEVEDDLTRHSREDLVVQRLMMTPGIGVLTATALRVSVVDAQRFPNGRKFACWLGLTASERSSGHRRLIGAISGRGDVYLRMLLVNGARSALLAAKVAHKAGKPLDALRSWAVRTEARVGHNKATVALANKLARIAWASWKHDRDFDGNWSTRHAKAA